MGADAFIEPLVVASILTAGVLINRRRKDVSVLQSFRTEAYDAGGCDSYGGGGRGSGSSSGTATPVPPCSESQWRERRFLGRTVRSRNTRVWRNTAASRFLAKFPFLVEVWYWLLVYWTYQLGRAFTAVTLQADITPIARLHALSVIAWEQRWGIFVEPEVQGWFLRRPGLLKLVNCTYSFIHIPGTITFLAWLYRSAPRPLFEARRRTLAACNLLAFVVFTAWPCMPPRLLPAEDGFGFVDTVHVGKVSSVWTSNRFCQQLAAMPSLHFGYSFVIGLTIATMPITTPSSPLASPPSAASSASPIRKRLILAAMGMSYPLAILVAIIATANHYVLDAAAGLVVALVGWHVNGVLTNLLSLEDTVYYFLRVHKPELGRGDGAASPGAGDLKVGPEAEWWRQA